MGVKELIGNELKEKIKQDKLVLIDFYADWCGPCKQLGPILEELSNESDGSYEIYKVDVDKDENREFIVDNLIMSIPTVVFYSKGEKVFNFVGLQDKQSIKEMMSQQKK